ncbi:MAG: AEC family transporter [Amphiplicatus sp.]
MPSILAVALPVFAVIAAGLAAGRLRLASAEDSAALNRFVFRFAMPAALFALMLGASGLQSTDGWLALGYGAPAMLAMFAAYQIGRRVFRLNRPDAGAHAFASSIGNAVFLGLPIALAIEGWARPFIVLMLVEWTVTLGVGAALMTSPDTDAPARDIKALRTAAIRPLKNPLVVAALAGFALSTLGVPLPGPARAFFDILGRAAGPTALFSLGLFLATQKMPPLRESAGKIVSIALVKMALLPALTLLLLAAFGVRDQHYVAAAALFTVTPTAVGAFVMASQYGFYTRETVAAIAATTALSILTISAVLVLFA